MMCGHHAKQKWVRLLAHVTGLVNQQLLLQNEYLAVVYCESDSAEGI
jgi:hypothetical protein